MGTLTKLIKEKFGEVLYQKSIEFPNNKINLIFLRYNHIKINGIILDNDREFHIIINQKRAEIFHDCPSFLIHSEKEKKVCVHFIKLLLLIKEALALSILHEFENYKLISENASPPALIDLTEVLSITSEGRQYISEEIAKIGVPA